MFKAVDRRHTHAIKIDRYRDKAVLPMWVADMDLATAPPVQQALQQRIGHPVHGYTHPWPELNQAVADWCANEYGWSIQTDWILWLPGVVPSFNLAIQAFARGGRVIVQEPNYPPLRAAAEARGCTPVRLAVRFDGERWIWDWEQLAAELAEPDCHLMILCNPMNPHGTVLGRDDLERLADLCRRHQVLLCSDEIHCDLRLDGGQHCPAGAIDSLREHSLTLMAASKTFNVAGLGCSFVIVPSAELRARFQRAGRDLVPHPSYPGYFAAEAAFTQGKPWLEALREHLRGNRDRLAEVINALPGLRYRPQPATFLAWIETDLAPGEALRHFAAAGVMPNDGADFGDPKAVRLNFGTDKDTLETALRRLQDYWRQKTPS